MGKRTLFLHGHHVVSVNFNRRQAHGGGFIGQEEHQENAVTNTHKSRYDEGHFPHIQFEQVRNQHAHKERAERVGRRPQRPFGRSFRGGEPVHQAFGYRREPHRLRHTVQTPGKRSQGYERQGNTHIAQEGLELRQEGERQVDKRRYKEPQGHYAADVAAVRQHAA